MYRQQDATKGDMAPTESNAITAYMAMLLGFLVKDNRENEQLLLTRLPNGSVSSLIVILERFVQLTREIEDAEREESAATATIAGGPAHGGIDAMLMMLEGRPDVDKVEMMEEVLMATAPVTTLELQERSPVDSLSELVEELKEIERRNRADEGERG
ncbi:hypothetical protein BC938DRAFT_474873 [Jimgerdemannia flammicorona]|uniref:Uncharacterized protein n=1 Tax=Jimgerdemannia flammicorona TaxID=994334 RepID=A0A433Q1H3_9FUNG|nr:hypothetical protein BC938DRAFT_474873 [Jimgerdemannia flammicorona]